MLIRRITACALAAGLIGSLTGCPSANQVLRAVGVSADIRFIQNNASSFVDGSATAGLSGTPAETLASISGCWGHVVSTAGELDETTGLPPGASLSDGYALLRFDGSSGAFRFETLVVATLAGVATFEVDFFTIGTVTPLGNGEFRGQVSDVRVAVGGQGDPTPVDDIDANADLLLRVELVGDDLALISISTEGGEVGVTRVYQRFDCQD